MRVIGNFREAAVIELDKKQTLYLIKNNRSAKLDKYSYYKVFISVNDVVDLYNYIKMEGLLCQN